MIHMLRLGIAILATAPLLSTPAFAFREYVPKECGSELTRFDPTGYRACLLRVMRIDAAETRLQEGDTSFRMLAVIDSPAMPIFIEFARAADGGIWLDVRSPFEGGQRYRTAVSPSRWQAIEQRWARDAEERARIDAARVAENEAKRAAGVETVCIGAGYIRLEVVTDAVTSIRPNVCDEAALAFPEFLLEQAIEAAGTCADQREDTPDSRRLLRCLKPLGTP